MKDNTKDDVEEKAPQTERDRVIGDKQLIGVVMIMCKIMTDWCNMTGALPPVTYFVTNKTNDMKTFCFHSKEEEDAGGVAIAKLVREGWAHRIISMCFGSAVPVKTKADLSKGEIDPYIEQMLKEGLTKHNDCIPVLSASMISRDFSGVLSGIVKVTQKDGKFSANYDDLKVMYQPSICFIGTDWFEGYRDAPAGV